ncbi:MAG: hypothetical protein EXS31_11530 [Pedosphaera sp.]|nr:hypothetical protein [Pedosphaera sp.]
MSNASKQRDCPAVGRLISAAECGENRHTRYACPAQCEHNPFAPANYSRFLEHEGKLDHACMDYLMKNAADRPAMERSFQKARNIPSIHALHAWYEWNLFFAPGADGLTCCQRWEKAGFSELKGDQRVLLRAKMQTRIALLEIHCVLDSERVEAVDLLAPGSPAFVFHDRSLARVAVRFASVVAWIYPLPHFWRLNGTAVSIPEMAQFPAEEIMAEIVRHLGGPTDLEAMPRWLAENLLRFDDALQATARTRRMQMFAGMDARYGKAVYELQAPFATCRDRLDEVQDVKPEDLSNPERQEGFAEARVWFAGSSSVKQEDTPRGRPVLGRILLGQSHWRVEAMSGERFAQLRKKFEQCLATSIRFTGERLDDLSAVMAAKEPRVNESLVPPRLLLEPQKIVLTSSRAHAPPGCQSREGAELEVMRAADRAFLEDQIPALDNKTPREAAHDPLLRPRLLRLLKQRVRRQDERNLESGRNEDINWLLRELGVTEIVFDPPPLRPPVSRPSPKPDTSDEDAVFPKQDPNLPPSPPLPGTPLSLEEASRRMIVGMRAFESAEEAEDSLCNSGLTLIEDASRITEGVLSDHEFSFAVPFLIRAALAFVPPGRRAPHLELTAIQERFRHNLQKLEVAIESGSVNPLEEFPKHSNQPNLMLILMKEIVRNAARLPEEDRISDPAQDIIFALLRAVVDELHNALRRR